MSTDKKFSILSQILSNEQQILQRADQKAYTLLSVLGVYSVFFIVHYTKIPLTKFTVTIIFFYFAAVLFTIFFLVLVVTPRIRSRISSAEQNIKSNNPLFFAGISKFETPEEYSKEITLLLGDPNTTVEVFAQSVHSIGKINAFKNKYLKYGIISLVIAVFLEFIIIISLYVDLIFK